MPTQKVTLVSVEPKYIGSKNSLYGQTTNPIQTIILTSTALASVNLTGGVFESGDDDTTIDNLMIKGESDPGYNIASGFVFISNAGDHQITVSGREISSNTTGTFLKSPDTTYDLLTEILSESNPPINS